MVVDRKFAIMYNLAMFTKLEAKMRIALIVLVAAVITGCGTLGGAVGGAGKDLSKVGDWIQSK
jgi:predicted small secreted protein